MRTIEQLRDDLDQLNHQLRETAYLSYTAYHRHKQHQKLFKLSESTKGIAALIDNCSLWQNKRISTQQTLQELRGQRNVLISEIAKISDRQSHSPDKSSHLLCVN